MNDLFDREQKIFDNAVEHLREIKNGTPCAINEFEFIVKEYGDLLKRFRSFTKISDKTTVDLNTSKLDLLDKVHCDALTGIYNRRFIEENLKRIVKSVSRFGGILSVLMIDIDAFKKYNDTYGHCMGDECLKSVARILSDTVQRPDDFAARYGGEEFIIILPNTDKNGACLIAKKLLKNVMELNIKHEKNEGYNCVTISIGVTTGAVNYTQNSGDYIKRADEALYISKNNGRNKYTFVNFEDKV